MLKTILTGAAAAAVLGWAATASASVWIATGSGGDGPESARAIITASANLLTIDLTSLEVNPTAAGQEVSGLVITLGSGPTTATYGGGTGDMIDIAGGGGVTDHGTLATTHWGVALSGGNIFLATAGTGAAGGSPVELIIDGGGIYTNANPSITGRNPQIEGTGHFLIDLTGADTPNVTGVSFEFGTGPDNSLTGECDRDCGFGGGGGGVPEPATWAMMLVGFGGLGVMMRRRRVVAA